VCETLLGFALFLVVLFLVGAGVYYTIVSSYSVWYSIAIIVIVTTLIGYIIGDDAQKLEKSNENLEKWFPQMNESMRRVHLKNLIEEKTTEIYGLLAWWVFIFLVNFAHIVRMVWF
jgi:hypothetical protein